MKKILIFSLNYFPKYVGGAEVAIKEIVERQDKSKYEFHMITLRFDTNLPKYELLHGIHVHRIGFSKPNASISDLKNSYLKYNKYVYQFLAPWYAGRLHKKEKFDAVWAMMAHSCGIPAGIFKNANREVKYILTLQEGDPTEHIEKIAKPVWPLFKNAFVKADIVQTISTFLLDWSKRMGHTGYGIVIPNGVDVKQFTRHITQEEKSEVVAKLGKKEGETWLITTSRIVHKNGVDDVIKAMKLLPEKYHFAILGIGPEEDRYKKLAQDLGVSDRVHFVGEIKHPLLCVYLSVCDIFIRPSRSEGMGNSFVEAMAMKMPVIATTEGGLSDFIFDHKTAWEVRKNDPESMKNAVLSIESSDKEKITGEAYNMVLERFDWELIGKRMDVEVFSKM